MNRVRLNGLNPPAPALGAAARSGSRAMLLAILLAGVALVSLVPAAAAAAPSLTVDAYSNTNAAPGSHYRLNLQISNVGDAQADGTGADPIVFTVDLPSRLSVDAVKDSEGNTISEGVGVEAFGTFFDSSAFGWSCTGDGPGPSPSIEAAHHIACSVPDRLGARSYILASVFFPFQPTISTVVTSDPTPETAVTHFAASGGGAPEVAGAKVTHISPAPAAFGVDSLDLRPTDSAGALYTQSAGHPDSIVTDLYFNSGPNPHVNVFGPKGEDAHPVAGTRNAVVDLPPGLVGNANVPARCTLGELVSDDQHGGSPLCPVGSQVGTVRLRINSILASTVISPIPLYNVTPPDGAAAVYGFDFLGTLTLLKATVRSGTDYGITIETPQISQGLDFFGGTFTFWGEPEDPAHTPERTCPGFFWTENPGFGTLNPSCPPAGPVRPIFRMPTACTAPGEGLPVSVALDSWPNPGARLADGRPDLSDPAWSTASIETHEAPGYPFAPSEWGAPHGVDGCEAVPFHPHLLVEPTTEEADSPSGLHLELSVPQDCWAHAEEVCESDLRDSAIRLPAGMTVNPSSADGQGSCTTAQIGLTSPQGQLPAQFTKDPQRCPDSSKIGTAEVSTPLLDHDLRGDVFLAAQGDNPFGSLLAIYIVLEDPETGIVTKLPGRIDSDPATGRLETVFDENPQVPFDRLTVDLAGGPRATLRTPPTCGSFAAQGRFSPWSGNATVRSDSGFEITSGPAGTPCPNHPFDPHLDAGTSNPLAGATSPFNLRLTRADGTQELAGLTATLPPGLTGYLAGIPYCPDSSLAAISAELGTGAGQEASPSCPPASRIGRVTVGAGAGPTPFFTQSGRAYLAGPYKGAPLSLAVVAPAVAGPFDLGSVVVRNALRIDPETAQITAVSDPFPAILYGVPLDLRDVRVELNRDHFTLNPTNCEEMQVGSTITSTTGATASPSQRFQVAGCDELGFKPKLSLKLKGKTNRGAHPALRATLTMPSGGANIAKAQVTLPKTQLLDNAHIRTICTRVQYAARECPQGSIYGYATAFTPLLDQPLQGPVYLRSSSHQLPDLVASLDGQIHIDLVGRIDAVRGRLRSTFENVPDAPVSKFVLNMQGGKKGLLVNETELCGARSRATVSFDAHNGRIRDLGPTVKADCGGARRKRGR